MKRTVTTLVILLGMSLTLSAFAETSYGVADGSAQVRSETKLDQLLTGKDGKSQQAAVPATQAQANNRQSSQQKANQNNEDNTFGNTPVSQAAFAEMVRSMMPLTPEQIRTLRALFDQSQKAAASYPGVPPRPTSSAIIVDVSPGATPPIVRLRKGFVTSLVFLDASGQPWPVKAYDLGDPKGFNIQWDQKSNTLLVQALYTYRSGNLAVLLKGYNTPIMVTLMPGQRAVDYRVDLRVPSMGPNAKPIMNGLPNTGTPQLLTFLNGVPPKGAKMLRVTGGQSQAWEYNGRLYLRTRLTVLSPGWIASMSSPDGTHAFELEKTPVVLVSRRGKITQLNIEGL